MTIHQKEDDLFERWCDHRIKLEGESVKDLFCPDGLHYIGNPNLESGNWLMKGDGREEQNWLESKFRILFLTKDYNAHDDGEGIDLRLETGLNNKYKNEKRLYYSFYGKYFMLFRSLIDLQNQGILKFSRDGIENADYFWHYPVVRLNVKKIAGKSSCPNATVKKYIDEDFEKIQEQLNIYDANILVCCNGSNWDPAASYSNPMMSMLNKIYPDLKKCGENGYLYYSVKKRVIVIHEWHMAAIVSYQHYFERIKGIDNFINENPNFLTTRE